MLGNLKRELFKDSNGDLKWVRFWDILRICDSFSVNQSFRVLKVGRGCFSKNSNNSLRNRLKIMIMEGRGEEISTETSGSKNIKKTRNS